MTRILLFKPSTNPTAPQAMPSLEHTDAAFAADPPALPSAKTALPTARPSRRSRRRCGPLAARAPYGTGPQTAPVDHPPCGAPRRRFRAASRQDHASDAAGRRGLFIGRRTETSIAGSQVRRATKDRLMPIQCRRPQSDIGRSRRMHLVGRDDLMFRFLNGDQFPELVGFGDLAFAKCTERFSASPVAVNRRAPVSAVVARAPSLKRKRSAERSHPLG
jgi:hypothetical protein